MIINNKYEWAVIGAGPAGIAVVGKLIDQGVSPKSIIWFDPYFQVGDLGRLWSNVSSNTKVQLFLDFLNSCKSFSYGTQSVDFTINHCNTNDTCTLKNIVEPLLWITEQFSSKVQMQKSFVRDLKLSNRVWSIKDDNTTYMALNVVLATGSIPINLDYPVKNVLPFADAIDERILASQTDKNATYAVFGSSHSAMIVIRNLVEIGVKRIINFYRSPCRYAVDMGDWTLFDNTGLKGQTAIWSRQNIDGKWPKNLERYICNQDNLDSYLKECDVAIYAVGFEARKDITIDEFESLSYNPHLGILGPGLFGLGIAYPETKPDRFGSFESQVGLAKFMLYLDKILPVWTKYNS